jgi:hypothetical protein
MIPEGDIGVSQLNRSKFCRLPVDNPRGSTAIDEVPANQLCPDKARVS